jgi:hypothetical protein
VDWETDLEAVKRLVVAARRCSRSPRLAASYTPSCAETHLRTPTEPPCSVQPKGTEMKARGRQKEWQLTRRDRSDPSEQLAIINDGRVRPLFPTATSLRVLAGLRPRSDPQQNCRISACSCQQAQLGAT